MWTKKTLLMTEGSFETTHKDSSGTKYLLIQYVLCIPELDNIDEELRYMFLRWSSTDKNDYSAIVRKKLTDKATMIVASHLE